jgi:hypothetical protein
MNRILIVSKSIEINATAEKVWDALINPEKIKSYLFGTETITDWEIGSPIIFQGEYDGHKYKDKGNVLQNKRNETLSYEYWSGFSGLEDKPENYSIVTYHIEDKANPLVFTWRQEGFASEEGQQHSENTLYGMLEEIKKLVEEE